MRREDFPIFHKNPWLIYFDSAATSQKPKYVIEEIRKFFEEYNSNVHRSANKLSEIATERFEKAREKVAKFINAKPHEIVFTKNSTEALNLIAYSLRKKIRKVTTTIMEHHSNFLPWQNLYKDFNVWLLDEEGKLKVERNGSELYAVVHASNVLGTINDIKEIREEIGDALLVVDGSQSAPHLKVDVKRMDVDFFAFTGHKMLASTGVGVLYVKEGNEKLMEPFLYGGEMVEKAGIKSSTFREMPYYFEAGTPNIMEVISLGAAITYLEKIGMENVRAHDIKLVKKTLKIMEELNIEVLGPKNAEERTGLVSFYIKGVHPHDISSLLDRRGIAIRSGLHCAHPLHEFLGIEASARASFYLYNEEWELEKFREALEEILNVFR